ncbi:type II toxin-antitoxin system VapC family toxin [Amycolatopsis suaedae]|uniref:Type II toxin-antitoxin system VapC family toxin n=1 Tax=Amycolatopsis suaedae TaxID=2510978 RepID=A0A4Q7J5H1_9PSEU|nr:type II toxin-antitoxin system VapC family toxin [Amycolatopsis suaedae]
MLDTCTVIDLERIDPGPLGDAVPLLSAISVAELASGLDTSDPLERHRRDERFRAILDAFDVLPFTTEAAKLYGVLCALVRQIGRDPRPRRMDLQIAATAAAHSLPLVTRNGKDFAGLERLVEIIEV